MTQQVNELIKLCVSFGPSDKWTLVVNRGSRDGIDANGYHSIRVMVTRHSLTIYQSKTNRVYIWCGYTDVVPWDSSSGRKLDANAFVFSLTETKHKRITKQRDMPLTIENFSFGSFHLLLSTK